MRWGKSKMRRLSLWGVTSIALLSLLACDDDANSDEPALDMRVVSDTGVPEPDAAVDPDDGVEPDAAVELDAAVIPDAMPVPLEALSLNSVIPNRGRTAGGERIRVIGTGFAAGMSLTIGGQVCGDLEIASQNLARCTTPPGIAGAAEVFALHEVVVDGSPERRQASLAEGYTFFDPVQVASIQPERIPARGGVPVEIRGVGLIEGTRVSIGGRPAGNLEYQMDGSILALAPAGMIGAADVTASNFNGSDTLVGGAFYYEDVDLRAVEPPVGPVGGGTAVVLQGTGLVRATRVLFGDGAAEVQAASDDRSELTVNSPAGPGPGPVSVSVSNENGEIALAGAFVYYDDSRDDFTVAGVAPPAGPVQGGNDVFVVGSGFSANTEITFDGRIVPCELMDAFRLRCVAPPSIAGAIDIGVSEGGETITLDDGYAYFETLEVIAIDPDRGSIAGGTVVTLSGTGFTPDMIVELGGQALEDLQIIDEITAVGVTAANTPGPVDVRASTEFSRAAIPGGYRYFDPVTRFGGVWGEDIQGAVNVTVLNGASGQVMPEAQVVVIGNDGDLTLRGITNNRGQVTLSDPELEAPLNVTAAAEGFEATTFEDVVTENVTIALQPNDGEGDPPPGVPAARLRGVATGLDLLPKPVQDRLINVMFVETSHTTPYNRTRLPPPGPGGLLMEDGPFDILARPGEVALIVTAAEIDRDVLKSYQDGDIDYWTMRQNIRPLALGLRRFISASPGQQIDGLDVDVDHPLDLIVPVDLDNPPRGGLGGPQFYAVLPRLNLGAAGYWEIDTQAVALEPNLSLRSMPRLEGWDADIEYYLIGLAFSDTADQTPMSISIEETRDVDAGVFITPFVGTPFFINPVVGGTLGLDRHVVWGVDDGFDGPIVQPSGNLVRISEPALGPPKPLWFYVTPSLVTEFDFPVLPQDAGSAGLGAGLMYLEISPFVARGAFNYEDFTYDDLVDWKAWSVGVTTFRP